MSNTKLTEMKHFMTLMALVVAVTAGAQVMDTIVIGNTVNMNLNHAKLDAIIADLQVKVATLEAAQTSSFDGEYSSLNNKPTIPSNVSDLTNDAGFTTFDGAYGNLTGAPTLATVATSGSYSDLSNQLTQKDIVESAYNLYGADLSGAYLTGADLSNAGLSGVTWTGAYIENCTGCTCIDNDNDNYCD